MRGKGEDTTAAASAPAFDDSDDVKVGVRQEMVDKPAQASYRSGSGMTLLNPTDGT